MKAKIVKKNGSWTASVKQGKEFKEYFVSNKSIRGMVGTVVTYEDADYQIQGYKEDKYLLSTFEDKTKQFEVDKKAVKHKLGFIKDGAYYYGDLIEKPTKQGTQHYFVITKKVKSNGRTKLEQKKSDKVSEIQSEVSNY
jgi:hypothetical protein